MYCPDDEYDYYTDYFFSEVMWRQHTVDHVISVNQIPTQDTKTIVECQKSVVVTTPYEPYTVNEVAIYEEKE